MGYLRKGGEPRPIAITSQEIAVTMWCIGLMFAVILVVMLPRRVEDPIGSGFIWYCYPLETIGFMLFMALFFNFFGIAWMCFNHSKFALNMWTDRVHSDWHPVLRADKNGLLTGQIMKKDSLGYIKGIVFGKKAGLINRPAFRLTLPNGNPCLLVLDFMSHNVNILEAIGWKLYKKKHGLLGYDAYVACKKEKKTLLTYEGKEPVAEAKEKKVLLEKEVFKPVEQPIVKKKRRWFKRRKKK